MPKYPASYSSHKALAGRLRRWRLARGLPLKRMAAELGFSVATINAWEKGRRFPSGRNLDILSSYTGIPVCAFFYPDNAPCPQAAFLPHRTRPS